MKGKQRPNWKQQQQQKKSVKELTEKKTEIE